MVNLSEEFQDIKSVVLQWTCTVLQTHTHEEIQKERPRNTFCIDKLKHPLSFLWLPLNETKIAVNVQCMETYRRASTYKMKEAGYVDDSSDTEIDSLTERRKIETQMEWKCCGT